MASVFISYRRDDSAATCGRIYDRLVMRSGFASVKVTVALGRAAPVEYDMPYLSTAKPSVRVVP